MPRGQYERKKLVPEPTAELKGLEGVAWEVAEILQENCGIPGCHPKFHLEHANRLVARFIRQGLIREE